MAVPTLTPGFTVLSTADATTGWVGTNTLDTEVFKQGTGGLSAILRTTGINQKYLTVSATDLRNTHLRIWLNYASIGFLETKVNGGIRLMVFDGTNTGYWYVGGRDTYGGGWTLLTVDTARAFDNGSCNLAAVTRVGFALNLTGAPRNAINTWWDYLVYGNGLTITGGTSNDPVTWADIYAADNAAGLGVVQRVNGVYYVSSNLTFGSASNVYFEDANQIVVFEDQPVSSTLYKIDALGTGITSFKLTNSVIKSASTNTRFDLNLANVQLDNLVFTGNTLVNADASEFRTGQTIAGCVFQGCNQVVPGGASFTNNIIRNSTVATGALRWPDGTSVQHCSFTGNNVAIEMPTTGNKSFVGIALSGNTVDINNTSGAAITVNVSGNGTAAGVTSTGSAVAIESAATLTLTGVVDGSEVRIYAAGTTTELYGLEAKQAGVSPAYSYTTPQDVDIVVHNLNYKYYRLENFALASSDAALPVAQIPDPNYRNP